MYSRKKYVKPYSHFFYVIIFLINGNIRLIIEDEEYNLCGGDAILIPPGVNHIPNIESDDVSAASISFSYSKNNLEECNKLFEKMDKLFSEINCKIYNKPSYLQLLSKCFHSTQTGSKYEIASSFYEILIYLLSGTRTHSDDDFNRILYGSEMTRLNKINTIANVHYDKDISLETLSKILFLSTKQTLRIIRSNYGCGWKELIVKKRLEVSADLLKTTSMPIEEIADYVGYDSVRGFYTAFKKFYGVNPGEYRNSK